MRAMKLPGWLLRWRWCGLLARCTTSTSKSVKKKWKDRAFAAGANREEITAAAEEFGVDLWEHVDNVIQAMRTIAPQLGLEGSPIPENN
jgi:hypothetical protein